MGLTVAIVGRPNVGKSTLFNRIVGRRLALVDDQPGVTRDLREGAGRIADLRFTVIDTAGLEEITDDSLQGRMRRLTERAVAMADVCLFLIDARAGVTPTDRVLADLLRRSGREIVLLANKAEGRAGEAGLLEAWELGLGEPVPLSAEHGEGMHDIYLRLLPASEAAEAEVALPEEPEDAPGALEAEGAENLPPAPDKPIQIAVMGRPNAGKSTLINRILGEDRLLTGPEAGITRDAISVEIDWGGRRMRLFDTAGMRRKARVQEKLEKLSVADGLRAIRFAEVVVLVIDVTIPFETQDLRLADLAEREGRAVVIAANKWDLEPNRSSKARELREALDRLLPQIAGAPLIPVSGLTGAGLDRLRAAVLEAHETWNARIPTAKLNQWLAGEVAAHPPPAPGGRRIKLRYMTQAKTRPPGFALFASVPEALPEDYRRFLVNGLRRDFGLKGTPIRLFVRGGQNPYEGKKPRKKTTLDKHRPRR